MAAQVGIAGSTDVEDDVVFGGQVGVGGHLTIGRGAIAVGQSGVTNSLDAGRIRRRLSRDRQPRLAQGLRPLPSASRDEATHRAARSARRQSSRAHSPNPKGHPSDSGRSQIALRRDGADGGGVGGFGASARPGPSRGAGAHGGVHVATRISHGRGASPVTTHATCGTPTSAGSSTFVDYGIGRFTFEANYQVVLGEEIRCFDPNQGNYILAGIVSARARGSKSRGSCITSHDISRIDRKRKPSTGTCSVGACSGVLNTARPPLMRVAIFVACS